MKIPLVAFTLFVALVTSAFSQNTSPAHAAWAGYFASLKSAIDKKDKTSLKKLVASKVTYEDGGVTDVHFINDAFETTHLATAVNTGKVSGTGSKRLLDSEVAQVEFVFVKGKWYLKTFNVGG